MTIIVVLEEIGGQPACQFENLDHEGDAVARLVTKLQQPNNQKMVKLSASEVQNLDSMGCDLIVWRTLDDALDDQLDQYGALLNEPRRGIGNEDYRRFLKARILSNLSTGTPDEITAILELLTGFSPIRYRALYPAAFILEFIGGPTIVDPVAARIARQIVEVSPAAVGLRGIVQARPGYWGFSEDPNASPIDVGFIAEDIAGGIGL